MRAEAKGLLLALCGVALACSSSEEKPAPAAPALPVRPNIVVVLTDDQAERSLPFMPTVQRELVERGLRFEHFLANDPICCPSRVTYLGAREK